MVPRSPRGNLADSPGLPRLLLHLLLLFLPRAPGAQQEWKARQGRTGNVWAWVGGAWRLEGSGWHGLWAPRKLRANWEVSPGRSRVPQPSRRPPRRRRPSLVSSPPRLAFGTRTWQPGRSQSARFISLLAPHDCWGEPWPGSPDFIPPRRRSASGLERSRPPGLRVPPPGRNPGAGHSPKGQVPLARPSPAFSSRSPGICSFFSLRPTFGRTATGCL